MCGIAGAVVAGRADESTASLMDRMAQQVAHRGPDEQRHFVDGRAALGFRRLSIVDPAGGHQPVVN